LLKDLTIDHPNQVWGTDITYIRLPSGFVYLIAFIDLYSRHIQSWSLSNTMDVRFCIDALKRGFSVYGIPKIINTDQGSQFTSYIWQDLLTENAILISQDGKGRSADNVYIERLWRTIKHEHLCFYEINTLTDLSNSIRQFVHFYNVERVHQALNYSTPYEVFNRRVKAPSLIHYSKRSGVLN
jgi:putative transposase